MISCKIYFILTFSIFRHKIVTSISRENESLINIPLCQNIHCKNFYKRTLFISQKRILSYLAKNLKKITKNSLILGKMRKPRDSGIKKETLVGLLLINLERRGLEPLTPTLPVLCATNCANAPFIFFISKKYMLAKNIFYVEHETQLVGLI